MPLWYLGSVFYMRFCRQYRINELRAIRKRYKKLLRSRKRPLIICANHLTKIDSLVLQWGLASFCSYFVCFKRFSWNLPERKRYKHNLFFRFVCYIGCCIPIDRGGDRKLVNRTLDKVKFLLQSKGIAMIFPEGKRSVTGKVDTEDYAYGVGRLIKSIKECDVLCIYMRGRHQETKSSVPAVGEQFYFDMQLITPESVYAGVRATRELAFQIINQLSKMEKKYFAFNWE